MKINKEREVKWLHFVWIPVVMITLITYAITDEPKYFFLIFAVVGIQAIILIGKWLWWIIKWIFVWIPSLIADKIIEKRVKEFVTQWRARKKNWIGNFDLPDNI